MECLSAAAVGDDEVAAVLGVDVGALQRYRSPERNSFTKESKISILKRRRCISLVIFQNW